MKVRATMALLGMLAGIALVAAPTRAATSFYAPPDPLGRAAPGTVIRSQRIAAPSGARAWRVLYHSRALDGRDVAVSGVVVAPSGPAPASGRTVVSWAHGTTGLGDRCAPSRSPGVAAELPWIREFVERGYVVAATDYEGLGTPGPHPYLVGESEGRGVLDAARAARGLPATGAGDSVVVVGHSQGGQAALFAGEIASRYAPDLDVRGVAALAPAAEPSAMLDVVPTHPEVLGFAAMTAEGVRAAFPSADVDAVLTPEADAAVTRFDAVACLFTTLAGFRDGHISVLRADPESVPSVREALHRSTAGNVVSNVPVRVYQGGRDVLVGPATTAAYLFRACAVGDHVSARLYPAADHGTVLEAATPDLLPWIDDRVAGNPVAGAC